jgi:hypothetical protein
MVENHVTSHSYPLPDGYPYAVFFMQKDANSLNYQR